MNKTIEDITKALAEPFPYADIEWRVGATNSEKTKGIALAYITNRAIQKRLDDVVGIDNWRNEFKEWKGKGTLCGLSIRINNEWITKWDGADDSEMEAIKGGLSDSMKRAGYQWGIGRYLYDLESEWVDTEARGKTTVLKGKPPLPDWALPDDEKGKKPWSGKPQPSRQQAPTQPTQPTPPRQNAPTPPAANPVTEADADNLLKESVKHAGGWEAVFETLNAHGLPSLDGKAKDETKPIIFECLTKFTRGEFDVLVKKVKALPFKSQTKPQGGNANG